MMTKFKERLKEFISKYHIRVLSDSKRALIARPIEFFDSENDKNVYSVSMQHDTEPMITIDIPLSKLEAIANLEATFFNNIENSHQRRTFEVWMQAQEEERSLRYRFAAVDEAYQAYSRILCWCRDKPSDFKDLPD
jgi:hypothetical protein